ncbi:hypothetical protein Poli38472_013122 [Pythium oligandrum]|uniref:BRCT domain-containing protein n=1 Tax=Pythium oligandrum TaxID=41045 RepID=A0A8K1FAN1_PYTOL|nr:hypothetical protein Poli38472_013122 [Pythium oligandrum]|eukprot:TMW55231.1 hypothetical protein Poli38472_013122 [Pythium oligandrum]
MASERHAGQEDGIFAGMAISTTGLPLHIKEQVRKIVLACGGAFSDDLELQTTTHLIADAVGSHKHRAAVTHSLPVLSSRWIFDSFRAHSALDTTLYTLRVLEGLVICTTGLSGPSREQVERLAALHGAIYEPNLEVGHTQVLIAQSIGGPKYDAAMEHGISIVHISWLHACIEKGGLVDEPAYTLEQMLRPRQLYKKLRQELDDLGGGASRRLIQRYWDAEKRRKRQDDDIVMGENNSETLDFIDLFDGCGFYLLGFPPEMEKSLQFLIRMGMGTIYYEMQIPAVSHVLVSPVLSDVARLEQLEQHVVMRNADAIVHFVSAKWLVDSLKCLRLEPEEMYPVEIEEAFEEAPPSRVPTPALAIDAETSLVDDAEDPVPEAKEEPTKQTKFFHEYGFVLVCIDPNEPKLVRSTVKEVQQRGGGIAVAMDARDVELVDPQQFDFLTHLVICSGVTLDEEGVERIKAKFAAFYERQQAPARSEDPSDTKRRRKRRSLRVVSDLWVRCCLAADCVLSHQAHELFAMTYNQPRSMFPTPLPIPCFKSVVASTSVYVGVDRVVVMELLRMAGATVTSKLSKRNTHLICLTPLGMKYEKAKEWQLCIVTARWVVQSVLQGELHDASLAEFQVLVDENLSESQESNYQ